MITEKKTIQINPDLFKIKNTNRTRKRPDVPPKIKVKTPATSKPQSNKTLRKNIIKMIRDNQQKKYEKIFAPSVEISPTQKPPLNDEFAKKFDETVDFFQALAKTNKDKIPKNHTIRANRKEGGSQQIKIPTDELISMELPDNFSDSFTSNERDTIPYSLPSTHAISGGSVPGISSIGHHIATSPVISSIKPVLKQTPTYGCLKGGNLPTYRQYTQKQNPTKTPVIDQWKASQKELREKFKNDQKDNTPPNPKKKILRNLKRRKIYKRTYCVGRDKIHPRIGVLISNRTVRNKISTDCQLLKQTPIQDVKKFLLKKGFIKVGTSAPNEVLRKMYESVSMICGEIQNHNSENFLYNYLHDSESRS